MVNQHGLTLGANPFLFPVLGRSQSPSSSVQHGYVQGLNRYKNQEPYESEERYDIMSFVCEDIEELQHR